MHYSPQVALLEAVLGFMLFLFFLHHSWRYDRLASLRLWQFHSSRHVFKKVMTVCYLLALPSLGVAGAIIATIKYQEGFVPAAVGGMPVPFELWPADLARFVKPMEILQMMVWFFDLVVHHQELTFWFWLVRATPSSPPWFQSAWFKFFLFGVVVYAALFATIGKLFIHDPIALERNVDISYASFTIAESLAFANVFHVFPSFIRNAKAQGGTSEVLGRLLSFHELNKIRIAARLMFGCCLFTLGMDAFTQRKLLNTNPAILDSLLFVSVIANVASALLTLLVFMPRAILKEHGLETSHPPQPVAQPPIGKETPQIMVQQGSYADGSDYFPNSMPATPGSQGGAQIIRRPSQAMAAGGSPGRPGGPPSRPLRPHRAQQSEDYDVAEPWEFTDEYYARNRTISDTGSMTKEELDTHRQANNGSAPFAMLEVKRNSRGGMADRVQVPTLNRLRAPEMERRANRLNPAISFYRSPIDLAAGAQAYHAPSHPSDASAVV